MENTITVQGKMDFMEKEIPVVSGGFGKDRMCILAKTVAEIHGVETKYVNKLVNNNRERFRDTVDILDLKTGSFGEPVLVSLGFTKAQVGNAMLN